MSGPPDHDARRDEVAAYAIGALDGAEALELERHLDGCARCREYLHWLDPATSLLPMSVSQHRSPTQLKRSLMGEVRGDVKAARRAERARQRESKGVWGTIWRPVTAVAATAVLVAGLVGGYALRANDDPVDMTTFVEAESTDGGVGAQMKATLERRGDRGTLHVDKLPALPKDRVYQAWIRRDGVLEPSTLFVINRDGAVEVAIEGSLAGATGVYITREPRRGSEHPSSPVIMGAPLN